MSQVARHVGGDVMRAADGVRIADAASLESFLGTVTRQMARDVIYDTLLEVAKADQIQAEESAILDRVVAAWDVVTMESHEANG